MRELLKKVVRHVPPVAAAYWKIWSVRFPGTRFYWEQRYRAGGNSGPGSYGRLARFKADVLNEFVKKHGVQSVIEFGCGDGHQLGLAEYPAYVGLDVSPAAVERCIERFRDDASKGFFLHAHKAFRDPQHLLSADAALSLDVIYHLSEDDVFDEYMTHLFDAAKRFVVVYSSNHDEPVAAYLRHRRFTAWIERNRPGWVLFDEVINPYPFDPLQPDETSFANFYFFRLSS